MMKKKLLVYSHDTYGLGNLRRMSAVSSYLAEQDAGLSTLLVSGSPMAHGFRLGRGVDYIKLPCLTRTGADGYAPKFLALGAAEVIKLRSDLLLSAVSNFKPDLLLVDKKPCGVKSELMATLHHVHTELPQTKLALILRDILDTPEATSGIWQRQGYYETIQYFYDLVLVLGVPEIFDPRREYAFPDFVSEKVRFCGYVRREPGHKSVDEVRRELGLEERDRLVVVTPGGGEDGYELVSNYVTVARCLPESARVFSLIVSGPEMRTEQRRQVCDAVAGTPRAAMIEFTDDLMSYLAAAEVVVAMGGYNTVCEILTLRRKAVLVPRVKPVREQLIRAERMAARGLLQYVHPDALSPETLGAALDAQLRSAAQPDFSELNALPHIASWVKELLS